MSVRSGADDSAMAASACWASRLFRRFSPSRFDAAADRDLGQQRALENVQVLQLRHRHLEVRLGRRDASASLSLPAASTARFACKRLFPAVFLPP